VPSFVFFVMARCCGGCVYGLSLPWVWAFRVTVPGCERDDFQTWETDNPIKWTDIPIYDREYIDVEDNGDGEDDGEEDDDIVEGMWVKGKYSKQQVDTWYQTSLRYWFSFVMSIM